MPSNPSGEIRAEVRAAEICPEEQRLTEIRLAEIREEEIRPAELRLVVVCLAKIRTAEIRTGEVWFRLYDSPLSNIPSLDTAN